VNNKKVVLQRTKNEATERLNNNQDYAYEIIFRLLY